jgi:hypothetical protein
VDDTGFLSLQLLIPLEESSTMKRKCGYVEFMVGLFSFRIMVWFGRLFVDGLG